MTNIDKALTNLDHSITDWKQQTPIPFSDFLEVLSAHPERVVRNVFQVFRDMIKSYLTEGSDEYPDDPESIHFVSYDCSRLFIEGTDHPFFADRLFANRLVNLVDAWKRGSQQNKIYVFEGPPGSGKSTFLNNLLLKFEQYANTEDGMRYEVVWRLNRHLLTGNRRHDIVTRLANILEQHDFENDEIEEAQGLIFSDEDFIEVPCPSHDHPIFMIPKSHRRSFFDDLFKNNELKWKLFTEKEFEWLFQGSPCTICGSLYDALLARLKKPIEVFRMLYARPYHLNRRVGEGVTVFNPGDKPLKNNILTNEMLQSRINALLKDSNKVRYLYSHYAKTNNGIYGMMDIKSHNMERLIELHNIISEGVHKVENLEENVNSLFIALMNPEDKKNIKNFHSFSDRIEYIKIPYVLDLNTEVEIYRNIFGKHIDDSFLPRVLHNFARVIISSRLSTTSEGMREWIEDTNTYRLYCDDNLQLLKMEIYTGHIPSWLSEDDRKRLTAKRRRKIIAESETEGWQGFSGRDAIKIFNEFFSTYARKDKLITMAILKNFFTKVHPELSNQLPAGFLDSLLRMYNYTILQEVKESLYYYNEDQISRDIQNYLFAVNFELGSTQTCTFTGDRLEITDSFLEGIETWLIGRDADRMRRQIFRQDTQKEYTASTLTQEIMFGKSVTETKLFSTLHDRYVHNLKEKALDPFLENENFRRAIKDYDRDEFKTYDKRIRNDVSFLMKNLCTKFRYTKNGAKEVCIYVIDNDLPRQFS